MKKRWIFGADFSRFMQCFSRFIRDINGENKISLLMIFFTATFSRFTPSRKRGRQKGDGKKTSENVMTNRSPSPPTPFCQRPPTPPLPSMSSGLQKRGKLVGEVRGSKDKTNGRDRNALSWHFLSRPLPGPLLTFTEIPPEKSSWAFSRPFRRETWQASQYFGKLHKHTKTLVSKFGWIADPKIRGISSRRQ